MENTLNTSPTAEFKNAAYSSNLEGLSAIHEADKNIAILERDISDLKKEVMTMQSSGMQFKASGSKEEILHELYSIENDQHHFTLLFQDIKALVETFEKVSRANSFRLNLITVNTNMCRRFHTDINDIRLLCTYSGLGTLWLPEEAADRDSQHDGGTNDDIVRKPELIQQAKEGDVLLLKGALYPNAEAIIHRSPSVEESGESRLLLRIDTNESLL